MSLLIPDPKERGILVVDDELGPRETLRFLLRTQGYSRIHAADSGRAALEQFKTCGPSIYLVLLDIRMPGMTGIEMFRHLAASHAYPIGVIAITGCPSAETRQEFLDAASQNVLALDYLSKPFETTEILHNVRQSLEHIQARRLVAKGRPGVDPSPSP